MLLILGDKAIQNRLGWQIISNGNAIMEEILQQGREARKGEARDEQAAPALLGPQGPSGVVRSDSPKLQGSRRGDLVGVLPHGKGARGGPAKKAKSAQGGNLRGCTPFGRHR